MLPVLMRPLGSKNAVLYPPPTRYARRASANEEAFTFAKLAPVKAPVAPSAEAPLVEPTVELAACVLAVGVDVEGVFAKSPVHSFGGAFTGAGAGSGLTSDPGLSTEASEAPVALSDVPVGAVCLCSSDVSCDVVGLLVSLAPALGTAGTTGTAGTAAREAGLVALDGVAVGVLSVCAL